MRWQNLVLIPFFAQFLSAATLHFQNGSLIRPINFSDYLTDGSSHFRPGTSHLLLAFNGPVGQDQLDLLTQAGAVITAFLPDNSLMVAVPDSFDPTVLNIEFATRLRPEQKLSPVQTLTSVVEFHTDVDPADARNLLVQSGLTILDHPDLLSNHYLVLGSTSGLEQWDEVDYIFPASQDLITGQHVYACASVVSGKAVVPMYVTADHGWTASGLNGVTLQYTFSNLTTKVDPALTVQELTRALNEWPKYANVHFTPGLNPTGPATVAIKFAEYDHGDGYPFDGPGGILAHTFYPVPTNPEPIAGDMHLDGSENWNVGADTDIYTVALHETGHSLGLGHTTVTTAIMYPYYRLGEQISNDDITGVQSLYGPPDGSQPAPAAPTTPATLPISLTIQNPTGTNLQTTAKTEALSGFVANAAGSPSVSWQTDHGQAGVATGSTAWSIAAVPLATGSNTITVTAVDSNHQTATQSVQVTQTAAVSVPAPAPPSAPTGPDTIPPTISIHSPSSTIVQTSQSTISVSGAASDNVAVANVTWQNTLAGSGTAVGTTNWTAPSIPLYPGTNTLILRAFDAAGNSGWRSITVVRN
jgi:Matrixin